MTPRAARIVWIVALALTTILFCALGGCAAPGRAGFRELARSNARERTALRAVAVSRERAGSHLARADATAALLSAAEERLTARQSALVASLRLELGQVRTELDGMGSSLTLAQGEIAARDAVIRQTRAEVDDAVSTAWWKKWKLAAAASVVAFIAGIFSAATLRALFASLVFALRSYLRI